MKKLLLILTLLFVINLVSAVTTDYKEYWDGTALAGSEIPLTFTNTNATSLNVDGGFGFDNSLEQILNTATTGQTDFNLSVDEDWTISLWFKSDTLGSADTILTHSRGTDDRLSLIKESDDSVRVKVGNSTVAFESVSSTVIVDSDWHSLIIVHNSAIIDMWLDGVNQTGTNGGGTTSYSGLRLGALGVAYYWDGGLDELKIFDRVLSSVEIAALYAENRGCDIPTDDMLLTSGVTTLCAGTYDLTDSGSDGIIRINGDDIELDCNGATLVGTNGTGEKAVRDFSNGDNITIRNCNFIDYGTGIHLDMQYKDGVYLYNNTISRVRTGGTYIRADEIVVENNTVSCFYDYPTGLIDGIEVQGTLSGVTIRGNIVGIGCDSGIKGTFNADDFLVENNIVNQSDRGIRWHNSNNGTIRNNMLDNNTNEADSYMVSINLQGDYGYGQITNVEVTNNTIINQPEICWQVAYYENITIHNDTCIQENALENTFSVGSQQGDKPCALYNTPMRIGFYQSDLSGQDQLNGGTANTVSNFFATHSASSNLLFENNTITDSKCYARIENGYDWSHDLTSYFTMNFTIADFLYNETRYLIPNSAENDTYTFWEKYGEWNNGWENMVANGSVTARELTLINAQPDNGATGQPFGFILKPSGDFNDVKNLSDDNVLAIDIVSFSLNFPYGEGIVLFSQGGGNGSGVIDVTVPNAGASITDNLLTVEWEDSNTYYGNGTNYKIYVNTTFVDSFSLITVNATLSGTSTSAAYSLTSTTPIDDTPLALITLGHGGSLETDPDCRAFISINYLNGSVQNSSVSTSSTNVSVSVSVVPTGDEVDSINIYMQKVAGSGTCEERFLFYDFTDDVFPKTLSDINLLPFSFSVGEYFVQVDSYDENNTLVDTGLSGLFNITTDAVLDISVVDYLGADLNSTIVVNSTSYYTDSVLSLNVLNGSCYSVSVNASGYNSNSSEVCITSVGTSSHDVVLYLYNSLNISIYDVTTLSLIAENISVTVTAGVAEVFSTVDGNILLTDLDIGLNELKFSNENYTESRFNVVIIDNSYGSLNVYLTPIGSTENVTFTYYNTNGAKVPGVLVGSYVLTNASYVLVSQAFTDISGKAYFSYDPDYSYLYNYSATNYISGSFILNPPREENYDITIAFAFTSIFYSSANVTGSFVWDNVTDLLTFSYVSSNSSFENYSYTVSKAINSRNVILCEDVSVALSDSFICDLSGYTGLIYIQGVVDGEVFFGQYFDLGGVANLFENLEPEDAAYISGFIILLIAMGSLIIKHPAAPLVGAVSGSFLLYILGIMTVLTQAIIVIEAVVAIIIIMGFKR